MAKTEWIGVKKQNAIKIVLSRISDGESLRKILPVNRNKEVLPSRPVFNEWLSDKDLASRYARACEDRAEGIFEEILEISDDSSQDTKITENGIEVPNSEFVQRSRLRVDARKWMLGKMQPKKYGDKLDLTTDGNALPSPTIIIKDV